LLPFYLLVKENSVAVWRNLTKNKISTFDSSKQKKDEKKGRKLRPTYIDLLHQTNY